MTFRTRPCIPHVSTDIDIQKHINSLINCGRYIQSENRWGDIMNKTAEQFREESEIELNEALEKFRKGRLDKKIGRIDLIKELLEIKPKGKKESKNEKSKDKRKKTKGGRRR